MGFDELEFAVCRTVTKYICHSGRKSRRARTRFQKSALSLPLSKHEPQNSVFSPDARADTLHALALLGSVLMERAAEEQWSTFYTADAAELCMSYVRSKQ